MANGLAVDLDDETTQCVGILPEREGTRMNESGCRPRARHGRLRPPRRGDDQAGLKADPRDQADSALAGRVDPQPGLGTERRQRHHHLLPDVRLDRQADGALFLGDVAGGGVEHLQVPAGRRLEPDLHLQRQLGGKGARGAVAVRVLPTQMDRHSFVSGLDPGNVVEHSPAGNGRRLREVKRGQRPGVLCAGAGCIPAPASAKAARAKNVMGVLLGGGIIKEGKQEGRPGFYRTPRQGFQVGAPAA